MSSPQLAIVDLKSDAIIGMKRQRSLQLQLVVEGDGRGNFGEMAETAHSPLVLCASTLRQGIAPSVRVATARTTQPPLRLQKQSGFTNATYPRSH
mmetsp:Transcript_28828/g.56485  ORF Transcript_28828/g.56485 Transcript_28828/m.56485 type:complete len:95 (-) Transcript_28828:985-1269(-)